MSVGPRAEQFNIVTNDYGHTKKCDFSVLEIPFLREFGPKTDNC